MLPLVAAYVMQHGLAGMSLRPLAKAAGTSDRMLIYHFGSKDALVAELLAFLAQNFTASLDAAFPQGRAASRRDCALTVMEITGREDFQPFFRIWWDIVAGCQRGDPAYLAAAGDIMDQLTLWVANHLPADDPDPDSGAQLVITAIEGAQMLAAIGRRGVGLAGISQLHQ